MQKNNSVTATASGTALESRQRSVSGALCGVAFFAGRDARTGTL